MKLARWAAIGAAIFALAYCQMLGVARHKYHDGDDCPPEARGIRC